MTKTTLAGKGLYENRQSVVCFAHIRSVNLAGVSSEDDFCTVDNAGQNRFQSGGLEVLGLVNYDDLSLQTATSQECDRLKS